MRFRRTSAALAVCLSLVVASCGGVGRARDATPGSTSAAGVTTRQQVSLTQAPPITGVVSPPTTASPTVPATRPPSTPTPAPTAGDPRAVRFTQRSFIDPATNGVTAISVLVPQGWQASGSVQWLPAWSRLAFLQTHVEEPNSRIAIDWLPIQNFLYFPAPTGFDVPIGGNYQGKAYVPPITDPVEFVRQFWIPNDLAELQSAQVASLVEVPAVANDFLTQFGGPAEAHAYRVRYSYTRQGQPWERDVSFALLFSGNASLVSWFVNFAYTVSAPAGVLDRAVGIVSTVFASRTTTPEWEANYRVVTQLFYKGIQQQMADTVAFGQLLAQYREESARLQQQVTNERQASQDHQAQLFRETLGGVQTYSDPVNRALVQLPVGWNTYWVNQKGEYLAVDQPGFDPNTLNDGSWLRLTARN